MRQHVLTVFTALLLFVCVSDAAAQAVAGDLFVSSRNTHSVKRYSGTTGAYLGDFVPPRSGGLSTTQEVAFGPDGHLYVSGRGNTHILKFDGTTGAFLGNFTSGYDLDNPTKMTFGPDGMIYVSQWGEQKRKVVRFDAVTGEFVDTFTVGGGLLAPNSVVFKPEGQPTPIEQEEEGPDEFGLEQNYPNPFHTKTEIAFKLPVSGHTTLKVYNNRGREVATLLDGFRRAGYHRARWTAEHIPNGLYFYHLHTPRATDTRSLVILDGY